MDKYFKLYKKIMCKDTDELCEGYENYLKSQHWGKLRLKVLENHPVCEKCGSDKILQIHHKTYDRLGDERLSDLQVLCQECHKKVHNKKHEKNKRIRKGKGRKKRRAVVINEIELPDMKISKTIRNARQKFFDKNCEHCLAFDDVLYCELNYKHCPSEKCGDFKKKG